MAEESKPTKKRRRHGKKAKPAAPVETDPSEAEAESNFEDELQWCVNQVLIGLVKNVVDPEQFKESKKVLTKLLGAKTSFVSKRHLMRVCFGDYRKRMATQQTLQQSRQELVEINKPLIESQLGLTIPYEYGPA